MSAELDMSQYLDLFMQEAEEQLEILESELLKLEEDPSQERMQVIFRAAHTLKGSSRAMGFAHFAELTHEMENVLDQLRAGTLTVSSEIADCLLAGIDSLSQMKESIGAGTGDACGDCGPLVAKLQGFLGTSPAPQPAKSGGAPKSNLSPDYFDALDDAAKSQSVYHATFSLTEDCVMKFVRAFMAINIIQESGEILVTVPDSEALEEEKFERDFELVFQSTADLAALTEQLNEVSEVASMTIVPWQRPVEEAEPAAVAQAPILAVSSAQTSSAAAAPAAQPGKKSETGQTVRVDVARLDNLMNLVGELVIDRTRIAQIGTDLSNTMDGPIVDALTETVSHIARITTDLQDQIMKARMMPIETVFNRFPRVIRDLAQKLGKEVKLELEGGETELDRSVIEVIGDPLLHILRNSVDHGLESPDDREQAGKPRTGKVTIRAKHQENHIVIEIIDDGRGINPEKIKAKAVESGIMSKEHADRMTDKEALHLIFGSGFSTAKEVSEVSGRGVGMDIVRSNIQKLGGIIDLDSKVGEGTFFSLRLPLTLAIIRGLLVRVNGNVYVLPLGSVVETMLLDEKEVQRINKREVIVIRGMTTPLVRLRSAFQTIGGQSVESSGPSYIVIVGLAEKRVGLIVDDLIGEQEVVIKSLSRFCGDVQGVSGATILGDGNVALIVDMNSFVRADKG